MPWSRNTLNYQHLPTNWDKLFPVMFPANEFISLLHFMTCPAKDPKSNLKNNPAQLPFLKVHRCAEHCRRPKEAYKNLWQLWTVLLTVLPMWVLKGDTTHSRKCYAVRAMETSVTQPWTSRLLEMHKLVSKWLQTQGTQRGEGADKRRKPDVEALQQGRGRGGLPWLLKQGRLSSQSPAQLLLACLVLVHVCVSVCECLLERVCECMSVSALYHLI